MKFRVDVPLADFQMLADVKESLNHVPHNVLNEWLQENGDQPDEDASLVEGNRIRLHGPISSAASSIREFFQVPAVSAKEFNEALGTIEGDIELRVNSPGGEVSEASVIDTALQERIMAGDTVNVVVEGMSGSAAAFLTLRANGSVEVAKLGKVMLHRANGIAFGNEADFTQAAERLRQTDKENLDVVMARVGDKVSREEMQSRMKQDYFLSATEAVEIGIANNIYGEAPVKDKNETDVQETLESETITEKEAEKPASDDFMYSGLRWPLFASLTT